MNLRKLILEKNECCIRGTKIKPCGIMVHSTAANNPWLKRYVGPDDGLLGVNQYGNHWNVYHPGGKDVSAHTYKNDGNGKCAVCGGRQACVHGFIGKLADGTIATYQTLPWDIKGWHAGGSANSKGYIGFEICEDGLTDKTYFNQVYREAVELTAYLCKEYGLNPLADGVVICHAEGYKRGIASNHGDVLHWFPKHGKSMDDFRADVAKELSGSTPDPAPAPNSDELYRVRKAWTDAGSQLGAFTVLDNAKRLADSNPGYTVFDATGAAVYPVTAFEPYRVQVTATALQIRTGPGTDHKAVGVTGKGVFTIVEDSTGAGSAAGWGRLKSGAGWIALDYCTKL